MRNPSLRTTARHAACRILVSTLLFLFVGTARAATVHASRPIGPAESGEVVAIDAMAAASLPRLEPEESVSAMWPVAPGRRVSIVLTRHEIYASDALIVAIEGGREVPVPRSRLKFFWGAAGDDLDSRVLVVLDPDKGTLEATSWSGGATYKLKRDSSSGAGSSRESSSREGYRLSRAEVETADGSAPTWSCDGEDGSLLAPEARLERPSSVKRPAQAAVTSAYTAVVAIDTDNEFMASRGDNNLTVVNYLANLIGTMNTQTYNPDFTPGSVTLVQGFTVLRTSTTPDPYSQGPGGNGSANSLELSEFSNYWSANYSYVHRALAMMVSGKQPGPSSASGIAWLGSHTSPLLCSTSNGYSFNQVFTNGTFYSTIAQLVAHEIGHNMGAAHTHCEGLDQCYSGEGGCYSGPTSCPVGGGTLMSYCHLLGGCTASAHFHPVQQVYVNSNFQNAANSGVCVFPAITGAPVPVGVAPNSGPMAGGSTIVINGSNFKADARVSINGVVATVVGTSPTQVTFLTPPAAAPAIVNVVVTNKQQPADLSATLTNVFTYTFNDVPVGNPFFSFVMKMAFDGISSGCGSGNFCVSSPVTRGQMSVFLLRSNDGSSYNPPACTTPLFTDVPCSNGFAPWINELSNRSVTAGCGGGLFCINSPVTRGQMAVFLLRTHDGAAYVPPACTTAPFTDVPCGSPYAIWVQELVARGITVGCGGGNFCLNNSVTRGQMAVFLVTTFNLP